MIPWAPVLIGAKLWHVFIGRLWKISLRRVRRYVLARMGIAYANRGYTSQYSDQTLTWERDIRFLRESLIQCVAHSITANSWGLLLEFSIPRKELRIDAVLLIRNTIVILEAKTGDIASQAKRQIEEYALLLHYFHKGSTDRRIVPILVSPESNEPDLMSLNQRELFPQLASYWVAPITRISWSQLSNLLLALEDGNELQMGAESWDNSPYFPVPSIIEAALALKSGLSIREIAHSEASEHEIEFVGQAIQGYVDRGSI